MSPDRFWIPNANVLINAAGELVIKVELAAMTKNDVEITVEGQRLTLSGHRPDPDGKGAQYLVLEMGHGRFEYVLDVPQEFDLLRSQAAYLNGMLRVVAPRRTFTS